MDRFLFQLRFGSDGHDRITCPACRCSGFMAGTLWNEEITDSEPGWGGYDEHGRWYGELTTETVEKTFSVEDFICPVCGLELFGTKEMPRLIC